MGRGGEAEVATAPAANPTDIEISDTAGAKVEIALRMLDLNLRAIGVTEKSAAYVTAVEKDLEMRLARLRHDEDERRRFDDGCHHVRMERKQRMLQASRISHQIRQNKLSAAEGKNGEPPRRAAEKARREAASMRHFNEVRHQHEKKVAKWEAKINREKEQAEREAAAACAQAWIGPIIAAVWLRKNLQLIHSNRDVLRTMMVRTRAVLKLQRSWMLHVRPHRMFRFKRAMGYIKRWMRGRVQDHLERKKINSANMMIAFLRDHRHGKMNQFASNVVKASRTLQRFWRSFSICTQVRH
jgi:hypothetical protein